MAASGFAGRERGARGWEEIDYPDDCEGFEVKRSSIHQCPRSWNGSQVPPESVARAGLAVSMGITPRQPGDPRSRARGQPGPWLCVPASRRVCPFEDPMCQVNRGEPAQTIGLDQSTWPGRQSASVILIAHDAEAVRTC